MTRPYLIHEDETKQGMRTLKTPWQSVGAKGAVTLAAKLMQAMLPVDTLSFSTCSMVNREKK